jgi:hypothetical protein
MAANGVKGDDGAVRITADAASLAEKTSVDDVKVEEVLARLERSRLVTAIDGALSVPDASKLAEFLEFLEMRERFGDAGG